MSKKMYTQRMIDRNDISNLVQIPKNEIFMITINKSHIHRKLVCLIVYNNIIIYLNQFQ